MKQLKIKISVVVLMTAVIFSSSCVKMFVTVIPTTPDSSQSLSNPLKLWVVTSECHATLESVDGVAVNTPQDAKDSKQYIFAAGERTIVMKDMISGQTQSITFTATAKNAYQIRRYRGNYVNEENGLRIFYFSQDVGVGVYTFSGWVAPSLVAFPQTPNGFARVIVGNDPKTKVLHLCDMPLAESESALLQFVPDSSYILAIMGNDLADPTIRYDYQGEYLRGDRPLPRLRNILGVQALLDYTSFIPERAIRFRPGEYKLLCFFQTGDLQSHTVSAPTFVNFTATAGAHFVFKGNFKSKVFDKDTWEPTIEPQQ